jgi:hypothetical protein
MGLRITMEQTLDMLNLLLKSHKEFRHLLLLDLVM